MSTPLNDAIRAELARLDDHYPYRAIDYARMHMAITAMLDVNQEHREILTSRGRFPDRIEECHCLGCQSVRAVASSLGLAMDGETT